MKEATVVILDLADSTRLLISMGDVHFAKFMLRFEKQVRTLIELHGGQEIDKTDGFLTVFDSSVNATRFALACQESMACSDLDSETRMQVRVGLHRGQVVVRTNNEHDVSRGAKRFDLDGLCKVTAARLMSLALPGQILASREIFDLSRVFADELADQPDIQWIAHGHYIFHGFDGVLEIFEIGRKSHAPLRPPPDSEKARRSVSAEEERTLGWRPARGKTVPSAPEWLLETKVGQGGYGEVWSAVHLDRPRERCIFKFCFQPDRLRALKREATLFRVLITALSQRNDIARILAWNFVRYPYYLQLEYSDWPDLQGWVLLQGGWKNVALEKRLELVAAVADAVDGAHQAGVLHKDIKPSNVLAGDRDGQVKVLLIDFGVGMLLPAETKLVTLTGLTDTQSASGTRIYMAPELHEGQPPSIRSDVYSLGILLFQTLAGDFSKSLSVGWEGYVSDPILRADIAACVNGRPERRLPTAAALAHSLRTVQERRDRAALREAEEAAEEQARKRAATNARRIKALTGAVALLLVGGSATLYLAVRAYKAEVRAKVQLNETLKATDRAQLAQLAISKERAAAEDLVAYMLNDLSTQLKKVSRVNLMDGVTTKALAYFNRNPNESMTDQQQLLRAKALSELGDLTFARGDFHESESAYDQARILASQIYAKNQDPDAGQTAAYVLEKLGMVAESTKMPAAAFYTDSLHLRTQLWNQKPHDAERTKAVADIFERLGYYWQWGARQPVGTHNLRLAFRFRKLLLEKNPDNAEYMHGLALSYRQYALTYANANVWHKLNLLQTALNLLNQALHKEPNNRPVKLAALEVMRSQAGLMLGKPSQWPSAIKKLNHLVQYTKSELVAEPDRLDNLKGIWQALILRAGYFWVSGKDRGMVEDLRDLVFWSHKLKQSNVDTFLQGTELGIAYGLGNNAWRALDTSSSTTESLRGLVEELQHSCADAPDHASSARMLTVLAKADAAEFETFLRNTYPTFSERWPEMHLLQNTRNPPPATPLLQETSKRFWRLNMVSQVTVPCMIRLYQPNANIPYYAVVTSGGKNLSTICTAPQTTGCWIQINDTAPRMIDELIAGTFAPDIVTIFFPATEIVERSTPAPH